MLIYRGITLFREYLAASIIFKHLRKSFKSININSFALFAPVSAISHRAVVRMLSFSLNKFSQSRTACVVISPCLFVDTLCFDCFLVNKLILFLIYIMQDYHPRPQPVLFLLFSCRVMYCFVCR